MSLRIEGFRCSKLNSCAGKGSIDDGGVGDRQARQWGLQKGWIIIRINFAFQNIQLDAKPRRVPLLNELEEMTWAFDLIPREVHNCTGTSHSLIQEVLRSKLAFALVKGFVNRGTREYDTIQSSLGEVDPLLNGLQETIKVSDCKVSSKDASILQVLQRKEKDGSKYRGGMGGAMFIFRTPCLGTVRIIPTWATARWHGTLWPLEVEETLSPKVPQVGKYFTYLCTLKLISHRLFRPG
ncbi:hypothetical protein CPB84DRAFT_1751917 [Gymnopilus junonius]|uniref:Uncharacterized protein n=1 Tax=Gymnopilus junonius TaxID=109634 RepID=A0A9P5NBX2_GYMJU|nr:hypothetical protein CPB84DRAFT_1751917 [Gymnopilus junonius]